MRPDTILKGRESPRAVICPKGSFGLNEFQLMEGNQLKVAQVAGIPAGIKIGEG
jgi:hypothetical protein